MECPSHHPGSVADVSTLDARFGAGLAALAAHFGGKFITGDAVRGQHANTLTWLPASVPDAVLMAETVQDVEAAVVIAATHRVPIIPFGAGTSLEGHTNAPDGGLSLDLSKMNRIIAVHADDLDIVVEPGVTLTQLDTELRDTGLFFPVDPGARHATLGGMAATRASGTTTVRYGSMRDNVMALSVVLADGRLVNTGSRARKSAAGYDLTRLFVGSEGTLGIIVGLTLRLWPRPATAWSGILAFPSLRAAADATVLAIQSGLDLSRIELIDQRMATAINRYSGTRLPEDGPVLFVDIEGSPEAVAEHARLMAEIADGAGGRLAEAALQDADRRQLWRGRHDAFWAVKSFWPGRTPVVTDACVPLSELADAIEAAARDAEALQLDAPILGHVGDGNFHAIAMIDPADGTQCDRLHRFVDGIARRAIAAGGTSTGEHGIGERKKSLLAVEAGEALSAMRAIKAALDPYRILNPGKIID
ncbi:MAG: FAD-linked oxidase C-terminal domain-containing protein [Hyphomicrobium sp.]|nr:FAD-linked oxidase C-terminal domain-containing protein [Hyphomicrobium sp.]